MKFWGKVEFEIMDKRICYIILHFLNDEITSGCIDSLLKIIKSNSQIIVIDNGSNNGSYERLERRYFDNEQIKVYSLHDNLGYARGNNYAYKLAKEMAEFHYIIFCNNDLIFDDENFEKILIYENEKLKYDIFGPDIINLNGIHQNPHRDSLLTLKEIKSKNIKKTLFLLVLYIKKKVKILRKYTVLEQKFELESLYKSRTLSKDIVLQGSCIVVGEQFIRNEEKVFCEETFLYFEEDLLSLYCKMKNYSVNIIENIHVKHLEGASTYGVANDDIDRWIFRIRNLIKSGKIYEKKIREYERRFK